MALVAAVPVKREIPGEPGQFVEIRRLAWKALKQARRAQQAEQREDMRALGAEFIAVILSSNAGREDERAQRLQKEIEAREWDLDQFDRETLLRKGIAGWSYEVPLSADAIEQLDEATAVYLAREIIAISRPPTEAEQKNDSGSSIAS